MTFSFLGKVSRFRRLGTILGLTFITTIVSAQTTRTWNGTTSSDWFNPTNWIPNGVPAANDIVNITNGGIVNLTAPVVISNQLYWSGAYLSGNSLTIASNAVMIINTDVGLILENSLTNGGTVIWSNNAAALDVVNNNSSYFGLIANQLGALFDIQSDGTLYNNAGTNASFYNSGALRKSVGSTISTYFQIPLINSGSVTDLQGTLNFQGGGPLTGIFAASSGTGISFSTGNFSNSTPVSMDGPGIFQLNGGTLTLLSSTISNLLLTGGTVFLGPAFQGGTITNLTTVGATLDGTNIVTGMLTCSNGIIDSGSLTIAPGGVMNIDGFGTFQVYVPLTNYGIVNWTNAGNLAVLNNQSRFLGLIENLSGALFDIQCDQTLYNGAGTTAYFHNVGTLRKSALTGTTTLQIPVLNSGNVVGLQGALDFDANGTLAGTFTAGSGAFVNFTGGDFTNSGPASINGSGTVQLEGASLFLLTDTLTNFPLTSGTVYLGPAFQGGTITNLTMVGATLAGTNTVTGTLTFSNGTIGLSATADSLTIASNAVMNLIGNGTMILECPLTNYGAVNWTNAGNLYVFNNNSYYFGLIENLASGLFDIQGDQTLLNTAGATAYFHNVGTLRKSALTGFASFDIPLFNSGNVIALQGTLGFSGGGPLTGTFSAAAPALISFYGGNYTNSVPVTMNGPGTNQLAGGASLWLLSNAIPNLLLAGGTVYLGPAFEGGSITNLTISGATLTGTNTVTGTFNWNNGTIAGGSMTIASNGVMNMDPTTTMLLESPLTNYGTVAWTNSTDAFSPSLELIYSGADLGLIENLSGSLFDMQCDETIFGSGPAYFHNTGTLQKSALTGASDISIPMTNSGTISSLSGNIDLSGGFTPVGGALLYGLSSPTSYGTMSIPGNATLAGSVGLLWLNGFVPANGNSFTLLTYGSHTGIFTNFTSPPGALWITNYGSTAFTATVSSINQLGFTTQPVGGRLTNVVLAPIVVQVEDPSSNAVPVSGVPITLSLNSGVGAINGTLTQSTDSSGKATFSNLSFSAPGTKTLRAASSGLTSAISVPFQILALIGLQWTNTGFAIQLNGSNNFSSVTIYASTNLGNPAAWAAIYTNPPTNGSIQFLDTAATNYPRRFYRFTQP